MKITTAFLSVCLFIGIQHKVHAQQKTIDLDSVQVTASRISLKKEDAGRSVTVITSEMLSTMPVNSVDDLMRFVVGTNVLTRGFPGVQTDMGIRGSTFSQVLVLLDGVRINDPLTAHFNQNIPVALSEIGQVEVIRGPASTSYGPDAVGGVIHIKTKTWLNQGKPGASASGRLTLGDNGLRITDAAVRHQKDGLHVSAHLRHSLSDGELLVNPNFGTTGADSLYRTDFNLLSFGAAVNWEMNKNWRLYGRISADERDFNAKFFYTRNPFDESREETSILRGQLALIHQKENHKTSLQLGFHQGEDLFVFNPLFSPNEHITRQYRLNFFHEIKNGQSTWLTGLQGGYRTIQSNDRGDRQDGGLGVYGIWLKDWGKGWQSQTSLRVEYDENFGLEVLPQLNISYQKNQLRLFANAGRAIRAADFTERFISTQFDTLAAGRNLGNPNLEAERSFQTEVGLNWRGKSNTTIEAAVFARFSSNQIDYINTVSSEIVAEPFLRPGAMYFYAQNLAQSNTYGAELSLRQRLLDKVELNLAYTWLQTPNPDQQLSKYVANHPSHNVQAGLRYTENAFYVQLLGQYQLRDAEQLPEIAGDVAQSYMLWNASLGIHPPERKLGLFLQVNNVFDVSYQDILGAALPGRWVMGGVSWDL